jgi:ATP-dependent RNA helicase RhlB
MLENEESKQAVERPQHPGFLTDTRFEDFNLPPEVLAGLKDAGFSHCTPIQAQVLPIALAGRDVAGQAQTGTGKTAAFLVAILTRLLAARDRKPDVPSALVVAPTRELALQIYQDATILGRHTGLRLAEVVGGVDYQRQAEILKQGTDIVICTPGRIIDYLKQGVFKTAGIQVLVIDEADRLFDLGFTKDMRYILRKLPHYEKRLSMLFSATLSYRVLALTYDYMNLPEFISVTPQEVTVEGVEQALFHVASEEKLPLLLGLFERERWNRVLIFANTKAGVEWLSQRLKGNGLPAEGITGDLPQKKRFQLMARFKAGSIKILVATDVASRGIHVEDISHVINFELPQDPESYIHRIGRTARAGRTGKAISFACEDCVFYLEPLETRLGYKIPIVWPEDSWFKEDKSGEVHPVAKERPKRPAGEKGRPRRQEAQPVHRFDRKIAMSSQPGGIFGLAPVRKAASEQEIPTEQKQKSKRRRRRRRPKAQHREEEEAHGIKSGTNRYS